MTLACPGGGGKPNCGSWDFESGTDLWTLDSTVVSVNASNGTFGVTNARAFGGSNSSLNLGFDNRNGQFSAAVAIRVRLCQSGQGLDLSGKTLSADLLLSRSSGTSLTQAFVGNDFYASYYSGSSSVGTSDFSYDLHDDGSWMPLSLSISQQAAATDIVLVFRIDSAWVGNLYVDHIQIQ
jgi:hypothetical protein